MRNNYITKVAKKLANLQLAITFLFTIGIIIAVGTIIEQDQSLAFYRENYPITKPLFGFLTWEIIVFLNLDQVYTAWWFLVLLLVFAGSLLACTFTTQLPSIKTFKLWKFYNKPEKVTELNISENISKGLFNTVAYQCNDNRYHFFRQQKKGYAYSGLLGRVAPVVVHASIVFLLIGSTLGSFGGFTAQEIVPRGEIAHIQNLTKFGNLSYIPQQNSFRINDFWITYTKDLKTDQFYSDLSLLSEEGKEIKRKTIFVNEPLLFDNTVFYQTDWDIVGMKLRLPTQEIFQIPLKKLTKGGRNFWFGSLIVDSINDKKISILVNDLKGQISIYDSNGILLSESGIGNSVNLDQNVSVQFLEFITSTGLQIKSDPGIQTVYLSFLLLMVSIYVSFFTYSQIWLIETTKKIVIGGKSNRAVLFFQQEFRKILKRAGTVLT